MESNTGESEWSTKAYVTNDETLSLILNGCGLVVRVSGYRSRGPGFHSLRFEMFWEGAGLERGPLSLVRTTEELLEEKVAAPV
jgi:hypothetical protein